MLGAVVAPEIVVVERLHGGVDKEDAGACSVERYACDGAAVDAGLSDYVAGGLGERTHLIGVGLGGLVGILAGPVKRVLGDGGGEAAALVVEQRDANTEGSEIYTSNEAHRSPETAGGRSQRNLVILQAAASLCVRQS